mgnify:CR=1 FL=1
MTAMFINGSTLEYTATPISKEKRDKENWWERTHNIPINEDTPEKENLDCTNIPYNEDEDVTDQDYYFKNKEPTTYRPPNNLPIIKGITTDIFLMLYNGRKSFMILKEWRDMYKKLVHVMILYEEKEMTSDVLISTKDFRFVNETHLIPKTQ